MTMLVKRLSYFSLSLLVIMSFSAQGQPAPADNATEATEPTLPTDPSAAAQEQAEAEAAAKAAKNAFRGQFGLEVSKVRQTRETQDDAELAQKLFAEAASGKHDPALTTLIYENAYELGIRDAMGYATASNALDKLIEQNAQRKFEIAEMRMTLWENWQENKPNDSTFDPEAYIDLTMSMSEKAVQAGDMVLALKFLNRGNRFASRHDSPRKNDIRDSISELIRMRKILDDIAALEQAIGTDPAAPDKLAMVYLAELDDPAKAATYADQMNDAALAAKVRLAAKMFEEATPAEANETGVYYYSLFTDNKASESIAMLIRARVWLTEYLSREHDEAEAQTIKTTLTTVGDIDEELLKRGIGKKLRRKMASLLRGEGQFGRPAEVQAAIDKGVAWLYTQRNPDRHWEVDSENHRNWGGYTALVVYAMLMADEDPRINGDLSRSVYFMMNADMKGTYPICFRIHAWEVLPRRERYQQTLVKDVADLRRGGTRHGFWGYTMSGTDVRPGERLDTSTTLAGGLGLWIGEEVGGVSPKKVYWERIARAMIDHQLNDKGWSYNPAVMKQSQGAMTAGALALLYASYPHLTDATKAKADEAIEKGMQWMDENFSPTTNVNRGGGFRCYYFAAVQHAGLFSGRQHFKEMDWYESIKDHLLKSQDASGSWGSVQETAFAIAFLCRGGIVYEPSENMIEEAKDANKANEAQPADEAKEADNVSPDTAATEAALTDTPAE